MKHRYSMTAKAITVIAVGAMVALPERMATAAEKSPYPPSISPSATGVPKAVPLPDLTVVSLAAQCSGAGATRQISAMVTIQNTSNTATKANATTLVKAIIKKSNSSPSPPQPAGSTVNLGSHTTPSGFTGQQSFSVQNAVPRASGAEYDVRASISTANQESNKNNNSAVKTVPCP